jgi:hypothetical protein
MAINFPNSPNTNDTFTSGSVTYKWDGEKWIGLDSSLSGGATPSQIVTGNTNVQTVDTGSDGHVKITTEGNERLRVTPTGEVVVGYAITEGVQAEKSFRLQVSGTKFEDSGIAQFRYQNSTSGATLALGHSRTSTQGSHTILQENDEYGKVRFYGSDGDNFGNPGAEISGRVDGTPGSNDMPGRLEFMTTADGATLPTTRMTIKSDGRIGINSAIPAATLDIHDIASTGPCLLLRGASITEGDIVTPDGEALGFGNWNYETSTYTERLRIASDGDIGIGTHSPDGRLHLTSGDSGDCELIIEADEDNNDETDHPRLVFMQDGGIRMGMLGFVSGMSNIGANVLTLASGGGSSGFTVATTQTDGWENAVRRMHIDDTGTFDLYTTRPPKFRNTAGTISAAVVTVMAQFNGKGTGTVRNSINVSSVSDLGTGKYRVNIDNDMNNDNYAAVASGGDDDTGNDNSTLEVRNFESGSFQIFSEDVDAGFIDRSNICTIVVTNSEIANYDN